MPDTDGNRRVGLRLVQYLVYIMRVAAVVSAVLVIACYFFLIKQTVQGDAVILAKVMNVMSDVFYVAFCVGVLLTELHLEFFLFEFSFMYTWPGRGIIQMFIAVDFLNSKQQIEAQELSSSTQDLITEICGYALLGVGFLYLLMGVLCIRRLTDSTESGRQKRVEFERRLHSHTKKKSKPTQEGDGTVEGAAASGTAGAAGGAVNGDDDELGGLEPGLQGDTLEGLEDDDDLGGAEYAAYEEEEPKEKKKKAKKEKKEKKKKR